MINVTQCFFQVGENVLEPVTQLSSASRQSDSVDRSNEKRRVQLGFQSPDLGGNSWLGEMKTPGCFGNFAGLRNSQEGMQ
jgi:hypothetical protein